MIIRTLRFKQDVTQSHRTRNSNIRQKDISCLNKRHILSSKLNFNKDRNTAIGAGMKKVLIEKLHFQSVFD